MFAELPNLAKEATVIPAYSPYFESGISQDFGAVLSQQLEALRSAQPNAYAHAESQQACLEESPNKVSELRAIVAIPVAADQERANIFATLEQYSSQDLPIQQFEIILHMNFFTDGSMNDQAKARDSALTLAEIQRFKEAHPSVVVRTMLTIYEDDKPTVGQIRAEMWNTIALDLHKRGRNEDILIISNDADTTKLHRSYMSRLCEEFKVSEADIVTAGLRWQMAPNLAHDSLTNRILRYQMFLDDIRDIHRDVVRTPDGNIGISLATYLAVGGVDPTVQVAEMKHLAQRIHDLYSENSDILPVNIARRCFDIYLTSNSRRLIAVMALGEIPYGGWVADQSILPFNDSDHLRTQPVQSQAAERQAELYAPEWVAKMSAKYLRHVEPEKRKRLQTGACRILKLDDNSLRS